MWQANLIFTAAVGCFVGARHGAATPALSSQPRFQGSLNRYYIWSWTHVENGQGLQEVKNSVEDISTVEVLNGHQTVAIVVHGREDSAFSEFAHTILNSFVNKDRSMAVILVDWAMVSHLTYQLASVSVPSVAEDLAKFIVNLEQQGKLDRSKLHFVGFDLGAHVVGITSRNPAVRARKITALDPAGEGWGAFSQRLRATDAQLVEVIHTDGEGEQAYGIGEPIGTLDFFPNGGTSQPGCGDNNHCSHHRAWHLFAASVDLNGHLIGRRCESMMQVQNDQCVGAYAILGTTELIKLQTGIYSLTTGQAVQRLNRKYNNKCFFFMK